MPRDTAPRLIVYTRQGPVTVPASGDPELDALLERMCRATGLLVGMGPNAPVPDPDADARAAMAGGA